MSRAKTSAFSCKTLRFFQPLPDSGEQEEELPRRPGAGTAALTRGLGGGRKQPVPERIWSAGAVMRIFRGGLEEFPPTWLPG